MQCNVNQEIRKAIKEAKLYQWQVAEACGVNECTFIRWLRHELSEERRKSIFKAIEELTQNDT